MKAKRHAKILELINSRPIETQDELLGLLADNGFPVTQATISRDIKELRLIKTLTPDGKYHYTAHGEAPKSEMSNKFLVIFSESVKEVDSAGNILVIKCYTGMANAVCAALDTLHWNGVVGTIAGDDTMLAIMRDDHNARELVMQLRKMMSASN
ncbi:MULTISPECIES: arginine repressor [Anaerotruncus]|jgi:transcriptional regulator of arginine metabolism|uniref:arginine repressor n=1 Tax=Anaerotruncus TaxID=244127 RepID=UPI000835769B|nr:MULTISPECIES: arginine repressor [Anaerotruncus]RGX56540.1 arginine repressor [Anaerotruncus sp. AF02-27]